MKLSLFGQNKKVLLVGEGNFSFAVTLIQHNVDIHLTATCYESILHETGKKNIDILKSYGIRVLLEVDATKLDKHRILNTEYFDIVVFNFPHVGGKMRIEKNRELLKNFFKSVSSIINSDGHIFVSLCDGQGGTPADKSSRKWNDSWQVTEMAAHGCFILVAIESFDSSLFETYTVTGYRSLEKQFNTEGSLTHIFKLAVAPNKNNIAPEQKIDLSEYYKKLLNWQDIFHNNSDLKHVYDENCNISLYPNFYKFDITFTINSEYKDTKFYEILYNYAGLIIENVEFLGYYMLSDLKKQTKTFRITYSSRKFPFHRKLVINIHQNLIVDIIEKNLNVIVSK